jgi:hypothetical protein
MRQAIVGDRVAPVAQDLPDGRLAGSARMSHGENCPWSCPDDGFLQLDRPPGNC